MLKRKSGFKIFNSMMLFMALLLVVVTAGCDRDHGTAVPSDTTAPTVSSTVPADGSTFVPINRKITAAFSEPMDSSTINTTTVTVKQGTTAVSGVVTYIGLVATCTPAANLAANTVYTATITTGARDLAGNALASSKVWTFTTGTTADSTAPTVSSTVPVDAATGVAINVKPAAIFSEVMDPATITRARFTVTGPGTTPVSGAVTYVGTTAIFTPAANLAASTLYTATITTGAKDLAGNALAINKVWTFTVGTAAAAGPAAVVLGTAGNYVILAETGVATVPSSVVTGNVGVSPIARIALTGWSETYDVTDTYATSGQVVAPFKLYAADLVGGTTSADLGTAVFNMQTAYTDAAGRTATSAATTNVGAGTLTSLTLAPGVYEWGSAVTIPTDLTLNGSAIDVWIFKVAGTLDMAAAKSVILNGGAQPQNIFWQVSGAVTIGANTHFEGIVLGKTSITFGNLASINGRLLAQTAIILDATTVTQP
jgi:hypothetical protein